MNSLVDENLIGEMPLLQKQEMIVKFIPHAIGHGKYCSRSAVHHLHRAWALRSLDQEMAVFRAFSAEEEAASAIFHAIKRLGYRGADQLDERDHIHKCAVHPFFQSVSEAFALSPSKNFEPTLEFDMRGKSPKVRTRFTVPWPDGAQRWMYPDPPLHFNLDQDGIRYDFFKEIERGCELRGVKSAIEYIRKRANRRNQMLYASARGVPKFAGDIDGFLLAQRDIAFTSLTAFLLIDGYSERQGFVEQCVIAFLKMVKRLPKALGAEPRLETN